MTDDRRFENFESFVESLLTHMHVPLPERLDVSIGLYDELGLDSIQALELLIIIEAWADLAVPPADIPEIFTLGDAWKYFCTACELAQAERSDRGV